MEAEEIKKTSSITDEGFKSKLSEIGINKSEVSILLPDECFDFKSNDCELKDGNEIKPIMFLGLNRSNPEKYNLPYHNMRGALLKFFNSNLFDEKDKKFLKNLNGAYLSDFVKNEILDKNGFKGSKSKEIEIFRFVKNTEGVLDECKEILEEEIKEFNINKKIFVFGLVAQKLIKEAYGETKFKDDKNFCKLNHYSGTNAGGRKKIPSEIREGLKNERHQK